MSRFFSKKENIEEIKRILSIDRYYTFYNLENKDDIKALQLYKENIQLSQQFYTSLHILEICLRNKIDTLFKERYGKDWLLSSSLPFSETQLKMLKEIKGSTQKENIVPLLQFGFWTSFFGRSFEEVWCKDLRTIFGVQKIRRGDIAAALRLMRELRNRIAHHEPIIQFPIEAYESSSHWLIQMMSPIALEWLQNELIKKDPK